MLSDVETLRSLPDRELRSGWAEAIKHGLIMDEGLLRRFEEEREPILGLDPSVAADVIRRSVAIKADVVSRDDPRSSCPAELRPHHRARHRGRHRLLAVPPRRGRKPWHDRRGAHKPRHGHPDRGGG